MLSANLKCKIDINTGLVSIASQKAFDRYARRLNDQFLAEFTAPKWSWPGFTRRKNGSTAGPARNIIDTGELINSQKFAITGETTATYSWQTHYASMVLSGFKTTSGTSYPGRNWVKSGLEAAPPAQYIAAGLRGVLS